MGRGEKTTREIMMVESFEKKEANKELLCALGSE